MLTYPGGWGPTEWGPIPFLPERDVLVANLERQWGQLDSYRGIATSAAGDCRCKWPACPSSKQPAA